VSFNLKLPTGLLDTQRGEHYVAPPTPDPEVPPMAGTREAIVLQGLALMESVPTGYPEDTGANDVLAA